MWEDEDKLDMNDEDHQHHNFMQSSKAWKEVLTMHDSDVSSSSADGAPEDSPNDTCVECHEKTSPKGNPWIGCSTCFRWWHVLCAFGRNEAKEAKLTTADGVDAFGDWNCDECS